MPDSNGLPTEAEVFAKLEFPAAGPITPKLRGDIAAIRSAVIAEFQSPPSRLPGGGGTGRQWLPTQETRTYDGSGGPDLVIDDVLPPVIVPAIGNAAAFVLNPLTVAFADGYAYDLDAPPLPVLRTPPSPSEGYHVLTFQSGSVQSGYTGLYSGFPRGQQNVAVTATFGSVLTADISEAIKCECAYRLLVQGFIPLTGVGESVSIGGFEINTSSGVSVWALSSPVAVFHERYLQCVSRHRRAPTREWSRLAARHQMS